MNKLTGRILLISVIYFMVALSNARAATFTVTNNSNAGAGSLRQAVLDANAAASNDLIVFDAGITNITVTTPIAITNNGTLDINGPGANVLTLTGTGTRIFAATNATLAIRRLRFTGGAAAGSIAIFITGGTTALEEIYVQNYNSGTSVLGAVYLSGGTNHRIANSTFSGNTATGECSTIRAGAGLTIVNSTVTGNTTTGSTGTGAVCAITGTTTIRNSTIVNNSSTGTSGYGGGGLFIINGAAADLGNTIIAGNTSGGYGPDIGRETTLSNLISAGGNLIGNNAGNASAPTSTAFPTGSPNANNDFVGTTGSLLNPMLGALANNGGTTPTRALLAGSPAIDTGINANAAGLIYDQRLGYTRFADGNGDTAATVDIGAFEYLAPTAASVSISGTVRSGKTGIARAAVSITGSSGVIYTAKTNSFGYYRIEGLPAGETYVVNVSAKGFEFAPRVVSLTEAVENLDFEAIE